MNSKASELLLLENSLHNALERGEFMVYYQVVKHVGNYSDGGTALAAPTLGLVL